MNIKLKNIILISLYTALFVVFSLYLTLNLFTIKITFQNLPIFVASMTLGTFSGFLVGFLGMLINQMITYGFTYTTIFWILPQSFLGLFIGILSKKKIIDINKKISFFIIILISQLFVTLLNTLAFYIDSKIFGYYNFPVVFGLFYIRIFASVILSIIFYFILPYIINITKKIH